MNYVKSKNKIKCPECGGVYTRLNIHKKVHTSDVGKNYNFADLFAGIGGFHLALHELGSTCVFASEWDEQARNTYHKNFYEKSSELFKSGNFVGDITKVPIKQIPDFDILAAGFPCQSFSTAGLTNGFKDTRGTMFFEIAKLIKSKQPKAFFLENVRNLKNMRDGEAFDRIEDIIRNKLNYSFEYKIVKASDFGLPQHRPRLFMVGFRDSRINFDFPDPIGINKTVSDVFRGDCERDIGYTLRVGGRGSGINDRRNWDSYIIDDEVVSLGVEESKEMMGLPPGFNFPVSKTQAMKQMGNSVAVPAVKAVGRRLIDTLNKRYS